MQLNNSRRSHVLTTLMSLAVQLVLANILNQIVVQHKYVQMETCAMDTLARFFQASLYGKE